MKKMVCLFLIANFLSLYSQEVNEEIAAAEVAVNERIDLLSADELGDFTGNIEELSFAPLTEQNDPLLSAAQSQKNGLYFLLPIGLRTFRVPGVAFRHDLSKNSFFELSYFNRKQSDIVRYEDPFFERESEEKLGAIYQNTVNALYGFKTNNGYVDPYFALGAGLYLPYVQYQQTSYVDALPAIASTLGLGFKYGFIDLAINYLPLKWKGTFEYEDAQGEQTLEHQLWLLGSLRLGLGFPF